MFIFYVFFENDGSDPSAGVPNLSVTGRGDIFSLGRILVGLVRVMMLPSRVCTVLDAALEAWDGIES